MGHVPAGGGGGRVRREVLEETHGQAAEDGARGSVFPSGRRAGSELPWASWQDERGGGSLPLSPGGAGHQHALQSPSAGPAAGRAQACSAGDCRPTERRRGAGGQRARPASLR